MYTKLKESVHNISFFFPYIFEFEYDILDAHFKPQVWRKMVLTPV